jgi:hypothetical protein
MSTPEPRRLLVVQVAGLGWDFARAHGLDTLDGLRFAPMQTVFPALTCTVQASLRTALAPSGHGMVANGLFFRDLRRAMFWEQSARLVHGERIWRAWRDAGRTVGMLFWQQSLGETADVLLSPAPIHKHHGGILPACYSLPHDLYDTLRGAVGRPFRLRDYWGPMASTRASRWIAEATAALLADPAARPDLCLTYLPGLDYDLQRYGPDGRRAARALADTVRDLRLLVRTAADQGYALVVFGDYAISACARGPVYPNRALAGAGLLATRTVAGRRYLDLHRSRAFAMADHEIAHVYLRDPSDADPARRALEALPGPPDILQRRSLADAGIAHANSGELVLAAAEGSWMACDWWRDPRRAPDFAAHVDIHNKPGYDPCELFAGWPPGTVSRRAGRVRGSHGRTGSARETACAWTLDGAAPASLLDLAAAVAAWLNEHAGGSATS